MAGFATLMLAKNFVFRWPDQIFHIYVLGGIAVVILGVWSLDILNRTSSRKQTIQFAYLGILGSFILAAMGIYWLTQTGNDPYAKDLPPAFEQRTSTLLSERGVDNPASKGTYAVETFTYGSGTDQHRKDYSTFVKYKTLTIDASRLLPDWKGKKKKWRERYWKFGVKEFPLNGRVYFPRLSAEAEGNRKYPLILIVHGNHSMIDYSDGGYAYLGELLASRGYIVVSVDENFINGHWSGDFMGKEMPTRAWLLLKHLEQWKQWNETSEHDLFNKVDMDNVMLVGHSRGGEAVSIAAAFNKLPHFPDNALERFDFNFNIKAIVSIAPTDYRYNRQIKLTNLNYLSLQGSYDSDETSFWGMRSYHRLKFTDDKNYIKAGVYIHKANHGQFNTSWGRADMGAPFKWLLNTKPLVSGEYQREAAKVFLSAFAEATLKANDSYLPIFKDVSVAKDWLPENYYLTQFKIVML